MKTPHWSDNLSDPDKKRLEEINPKWRDYDSMEEAIFYGGDHKPKQAQETQKPHE